MSNTKSLRFEDGTVWGVGSFLVGDADVCIPVDEIGDLSNEEIGARVRLLIPHAVNLMAEEIIEGNGIEGTLKHHDGEWFVKMSDLLELADDPLPHIIVLQFVVREGLKKYSRQLRREGVEKKQKSGWVYLAHAETGHYKIGKSKNPESRIKVFDTKMPIEVRILHTFRADNPGQAELSLHEKYNHKHHQGEWFNLDRDDVTFVMGITHYEDGQFHRIVKD